jgi:DNA repair exonuclease SbcCD nuclease subunit
MQFLQTGDIHIGECRTLPGYLERHEAVLDAIHAESVRLRLPLVIAGDLFHTKTPTAEERYLADRWIGKREKSGLFTLLIAGNHDHLWGARTLIDGYRNFPFQHVKVVGFEPEAVLFGTTLFVCVSWGGYSKEQLAAIVTRLAEQPQHILMWDEESQQAKRIENMHYSMVEYCVVVCHECISGSKADNGRILPKGTALPDLPFVTYWAIGDIHSQQTTNLANGFYAGAPAQFKFDDQLRKGILHVDLNSPTCPAFLPIKSKPLRVVSSVQEITDDAYYLVEGEIEEVLKANKQANVVRTSWAKHERQVIAYEKRDLTFGLPEFLAERGIDSPFQTEALGWVNDVLAKLSQAGVS